VIPEHFFVMKFNNWQQELDEIENKLKEHRNADKDYILFGVSIIETARDAAKTYLGAKPEYQGEIAKFIYSKLSFDGVTTEYKYKKPFDLVAKGLIRQDWLTQVCQFRTELIELAA